MEQAYAALLDDLRERGLLDTTLVVWMGDFGRTPMINNDAGRDHWPQCYTMVLAGGGIRGGQSVRRIGQPRRCAEIIPGRTRRYSRHRLHGARLRSSRHHVPLRRRQAVSAVGGDRNHVAPCVSFSLANLAASAGITGDISKSPPVPALSRRYTKMRKHTGLSDRGGAFPDRARLRNTNQQARLCRASDPRIRLASERWAQRHPAD